MPVSRPYNTSIVNKMINFNYKISRKNYPFEFTYKTVPKVLGIYEVNLEYFIKEYNIILPTVQ